MRVATFNVHGFVGRGGWDPDLCARALSGLRADLIALQEVRVGARRMGVLDEIAAALGATALRGPTMSWPSGAWYGNALLCRTGRIEDWTTIDLGWKGAEPRGAIVARWIGPGGAHSVACAHFGLTARERRAQARRLLGHLADHGEARQVALGDLNVWWPRSSIGALLAEAFEASAAPPSFPARRPTLRLDRVYARSRRPLERAAIRRAWVPRSRAARAASDHAPVAAEISWEPEASGPRRPQHAPDRDAKWGARRETEILSNFSGLGHDARGVLDNLFSAR